MAEIKGVLLGAWMGLLKQRYGEQAVSHAMLSLAEPDRKLVSNLFLDSSWYPFDTLQSLRRLTRFLVTSKDTDMVTEIGRHMAETACTGVYKSLLGKGPVKQAERFTWVEELLFKSARKMSVDITGPNSCIVRYVYEAGSKPTESICVSHQGFFSKMLELSGAAEVRCRHVKCAARGDACCEFHYEWDT
jgi:predicted hydrocarbon binding protein